MTNTSYEVGDTLSYNTFTGGLRTVRVTLKDPDIKNGRPGFDGIVLDGFEDGGNVWGYDDQIVEVLERGGDVIDGEIVLREIES